MFLTQWIQKIIVCCSCTPGLWRFDSLFTVQTTKNHILNSCSDSVKGLWFGWKSSRGGGGGGVCGGGLPQYIFSLGFKSPFLFERAETEEKSGLEKLISGQFVPWLEWKSWNLDVNMSAARNNVQAWMLILQCDTRRAIDSWVTFRRWNEMKSTVITMTTKKC